MGSKTSTTLPHKRPALDKLVPLFHSVFDSDLKSRVRIPCPALKIKRSHRSTSGRTDMQKWEYAHARYDGKTIEPHPQKALSDITEISLFDFVDRAGAAGWELCGIVPYPEGKVSASNDIAVIFKRPQKEKPVPITHESAHPII